MDANIFNSLKTGTLGKDGEIKISKVAGWALWDPKDPANTRYIEDHVDRLKNNIVFVGLNFARPVPDWPDWSNFRPERDIKGKLHLHSDGRIQEVLAGTRFEGAYMTDIIKNYPQVDPNEVWSQIQKGSIDIKTNIAYFFKEIDMLESDNIELYLFGKDVENVFKEHIIVSEYLFLFRQKIKLCQRIEHYSRANPDFLPNVPGQLGIPDAPKPLRVYKPLWPVTERP